MGLINSSVETWTTKEKRTTFDKKLIRKGGAGRCHVIYHPLQAWEHKTYKTPNGKTVIKWKPPSFNDKENWKDIMLPCGQCIGCRMDNAQDWAIRCILEAKLHEKNYFITLTYNSENIPYHSEEVLLDEETGEIGYQTTLVKKHMQTFMKDLRSHFNYDFGHQGIRFYGCGEYGSNTKRPHYHIILFNCPIPDLEPLFVNKNHQQVYTSKYIENIWGKGIVSIGEVTYESRAYTRRYILKKQHINELKPGRRQEFTNMSRMPGIAREYYEKNGAEIYKNDELTIKKALGKAINTKPPKYFDELYEKEHETELSDIKKKRRERRQEARERKQLRTSLSPIQQLEVAERTFASKVATLKRNLKEED